MDLQILFFSELGFFSCACVSYRRPCFFVLFHRMIFVVKKTKFDYVEINFSVQRIILVVGVEAILFYFIYLFIFKYGTLHEFACHPCAGAMLIFSVSFQFQYMCCRSEHSYFILILHFRNTHCQSNFVKGNSLNWA